MPEPLLFQRAHALLLRGWCRFALARTALGKPCHPNAPQAASWSLHGALMRASFETGLDAEYDAARTALKDAVWAKHRLYLMWCDDSPDFSARAALDILHALAH